MRARWPRLARTVAFALACVTMTVAGPLAAIALGSGSHGTGGVGLPTTATTTTTTGTGTTPTIGSPAPKPIPVPKNNPFARRAMWIWVLSLTDKGNVSKIIAQAKAKDVGTLFIKSGDGTNNWTQFNPTLVAQLHAAGLKVCAWQYVYGEDPVGEAKVADDAIKEGADCLAIDAESQYQGKYLQAQQYVAELRKLAGAKFPLALAGFPYVFDHLNFPYSVFLGAGGAQYNVPQMYWYDIYQGQSGAVEDVYAVTYSYNEIYKRPIFPLGQLYPSGSKDKPPPVSQIEQFNTLAKDYGATGTSWYDWQSASATSMAAISKSAALPAGFARYTTAATVQDHNLGDLVVWAQEYLDGWLQHKTGSTKSDIPVDGDFAKKTLAAVKAFQLAHHIDPTGVIDGVTWDALLKVTPAKVTWVSKKGKLSATVGMP